MEKFFMIIFILLVTIGCNNGPPPESKPDVITNIDKIFFGKYSLIYFRRENDSDEVEYKHLKFCPNRMSIHLAGDVTKPSIVITKKWVSVMAAYHEEEYINIILPKERYLDLISPGTTDDGSKARREIKLEELYSR